MGRMKGCLWLTAGLVVAGLAGLVAFSFLNSAPQADPQSAEVKEAVIASKPEAGTTSDLAPVYWEAMLATGRTGRLAPALEEAIKSAPRPVAARAHTLRGDLLKSENRPRDALKDGYLRTITLFRDVRDAQPEALFKAAVAFEALQQVQYAESMRQRLLSGYADSDYAKRLRGK